jgi:uncharacterized protein
MYLPRTARFFLCLLFLVPAQVGWAEATRHGQALFWAIDSGTQRVGYLLGTIHSEDARVLEYTEGFLNALHGSSHFAMELVPDLPTLARLTEAMHLAPGTELAAMIGEKRFEAVARALAGYGLPRSEVARLKPWAAMVTLSLPPPRTGLIMDFSLSLRAAGQGLEVLGLETLDEQLGFLESMSLPQQISMLDQALSESYRVEAVHREMVGTYLAGDLDALRAEAMEQLSGLDEELGEFFIAEGIVARNQRMFARLRGLLEESDIVFVAVGALHLPGENGLLELLRDGGFRLVPMPSPFPGTP